MRQFIDTSTVVRDGEELDLAGLESYLETHKSGVAGPLALEQFPSGYSNLTYLLRIGGREYVLRRPPFGSRVKSAHDMGREYHVLSKLSQVYELAPRPLLYCDDESVLGAPFYIMERRTGIILRKQVPAGMNLDSGTLRKLGESFVDNLVRLHGVDYNAAGLSELGKPEGYVERQVTGWADRYQRSRTDDVPDMETTAAWLAGHMPAGGGAALIHNDYKFDNLVLDASDVTRIIAVLDWEMCTLGDPLMDLGCTLAYWVEPGDSDELKQCSFGPTTLPGNLTRAELIARYASQSGRNVSNMLFFYCFGLFKLAVIVQQIYYRYVHGHTRDPRFAQLNGQVAILGRTAVAAVEKGRLD